MEMFKMNNQNWTHQRSNNNLKYRWVFEKSLAKLQSLKLYITNRKFIDNIFIFSLARALRITLAGLNLIVEKHEEQSK